MLNNPRTAPRTSRSGTRSSRTGATSATTCARAGAPCSARRWRSSRSSTSRPSTGSGSPGWARLRRGFWLAGWLLKSLFLKLTPLRRVIFLVALVLLVLVAEAGDDRQRHERGRRLAACSAAFLLVGLLLLELKDKLLARHELEAGRAVQRALMPDRCPSLAGWDVWLYTRPANDVGGDLVDCLELGPGRVGFTLADVAGKALPAALLMAKVQSTLRALATDAPSLERPGREDQRHPVPRRPAQPVRDAPLLRPAGQRRRGAPGQRRPHAAGARLGRRIPRTAARGHGARHDAGGVVPRAAA